MKVVVENIINELYGSEIQNLGSDIEIIALSPENHMDPAWDEVSDIDALFLSYQFLFAVRDHKHLFEPMLNCLLYTSPSPRDGLLSRMPSSA